MILRTLFVLVGFVGVLGVSPIFASNADGNRTHNYFRVQLPLTAWGTDAWASRESLRHTPKYTRTWIGLAFGRDFYKRFGAEIALGLMASIQAAGRYYLSDVGFQPFVLLGGAYHWYDELAFDWEGTDTKGPAAFGGLGVRWKIWNKFCLTTQFYLNAYYSSLSKGDTGSPDLRSGNGWLLFATYEIAGLEWRF